MATPNKTRVQVAKKTTFSTTEVLSDKNQGYATAIPYGANELTYGIDLYGRALHGSVSTGDSDWSPIINFKITPPEDVIGICMYGTGNRIGDFRRIDAAGNFLSSFNYQTHPIYNYKMRDVVIDGCAMKEFDTLYVRTEAEGILGSDSAGKKCWWISGTQYPNYRPMAAFKRESMVKPKIWISRYLGHVEKVRGRVTFGSKLNQTAASMPFADKNIFRASVTNRNDVEAGITGFHMLDIWEMSLLRLIGLIFGGGSDMQSIWGAGSVIGTQFPIRTGANNAEILGICDLWRCFSYYLDGIQMKMGESAKILDPSSGAYVQTNWAPISQGGWIVDVWDQKVNIGAHEHDLMELFLPKSVNGTEVNGTFADYNTQWLYSSRFDTTAFRLLMAGSSCKQTTQNITIVTSTAALADTYTAPALTLEGISTYTVDPASVTEDLFNTGVSPDADPNSTWSDTLYTTEPGLFFTDVELSENELTTTNALGSAVTQRIYKNTGVRFAKY